MKTRIQIVLLCCAGSAFAQSQIPDPSQGVGDAPKVYVRRFSIGATLGVLALPVIPTASTSASTTTPVTATNYNTTAASPRVGYGVTGQVAITEHFAVAVSALYRKFGYKMDTTLTTGATTTVTTAVTTSTHEDTRSKVIDVPATLRYYVKGRHTPGVRFFGEGGAAWRDVFNTRATVTATDSAGTTTCCTTPTGRPASKSVIGYVAGFGVQAIDPVGIRVVPEVRYTHWNKQIFSSQSTRTKADSVEIVISLTF